jgi:hypothetical protein
LFFGVVEDANEDCSKKHGTNNRPRPIIVKFHRYSDKEAIKAKGPMFKDTPFGVRDQYPREVMARRNELYPIMKRERATEGRCVDW